MMEKTLYSLMSEEIFPLLGKVGTGKLKAKAKEILIMKIGIAQMECIVGNVNSNLNKMSGFIEKAAEAGCRVVVFPEMVDTGYDVNQIARHASSWDRGPIECIQTNAKQNNMYVICGLSELANGRIYNVMAVVSPDGHLMAKYRKTHLAAFSPLHEDKIFTPGNSLETVEIDNMTWGLMICYDLRFPEISRSLALKGSEVLVLSSAWPFPRLRHWNTLLAARAIENQVFVAAANLVGKNSSVTFCGSSRIIDPFGITITSASEEQEALIVGDIEKNELVRVRKSMPVFEQRREDLYCHTMLHKHCE
jgi:omega-amidase